MFLRSLFYERTVLSHLERVRQLPPEAQAEIAMRVSNFIELARPVSDDLYLGLLRLRGRSSNER